MADAISGKTTAQLVEAAYLAIELMRLGAASVSTSLYQGPISFAIWRIMDPAPGHVSVDPAAERNVREAQNAYQSGAISVAAFPGVRIFVPDNPSIQSFLTPPLRGLAAESVSTPEPGTADSWLRV